MPPKCVVFPHAFRTLAQLFWCHIRPPPPQFERPQLQHLSIAPARCKNPFTFSRCRPRLCPRNASITEFRGDNLGARSTAPFSSTYGSTSSCYYFWVPLSKGTICHAVFLLLHAGHVFAVHVLRVSILMLIDLFSLCAIVRALTASFSPSATLCFARPPSPYVLSTRAELVWVPPPCQCFTVPLCTRMKFELDVFVVIKCGKRACAGASGPNFGNK